MNENMLTRGNMGILIGVGMVLLALGFLAYSAWSASNRKKRYRKGIARRKASDTETQ